jgi:hypothetical protein
MEFTVKFHKFNTEARVVEVFAVADVTATVFDPVIEGDAPTVAVSSFSVAGRELNAAEFDAFVEALECGIDIVALQIVRTAYARANVADCYNTRGDALSMHFWATPGADYTPVEFVD